MAGKCRAIPTAPIMAILVAVLMAVAVTGVAVRLGYSSLTTWSAPRSGETSTIRSPGCIDLVFYAGLEFYYQGEAATLYTETGCAGTPYQLLEDTQACGDFGWRSINIDS